MKLIVFKLKTQFTIRQIVQSCLSLSPDSVTDTSQNESLSLSDKKAAISFDDQVNLN